MQAEVASCQCAASCRLSGPCPHPVTQEDWLCDMCRPFKGCTAMFADHCHACGDKPVDEEERDAEDAEGVRLRLGGRG
jgi:hypothetical protein